MKKTIILAFILLPLISVFGQNQFNMTQYMVHQPFINPASAGAKQNLNAALFYRAQYVGFQGAPRVAGFNINTPIAKGNSNVGLSLINDQIGVNQFTDVSFNYSYRIKFSQKSQLSLGAAAILGLIQSDFASVQTNGVTDPTFSSNTPTIVAPNFKFGMYYQYDRFYIGVTTPKILQNNISYSGKYVNNNRFDASQMHLYAQAGYRFSLGQNTDLHTSVLFKNVSGAPMQLDVNALFEFKNTFGIGFSVRSNGDLSPIIQYRFAKMLKLSYSYDYAMNALSNYSKGSHEIMLVLDILNKKAPMRMVSPRF